MFLIFRRSWGYIFNDDPGKLTLLDLDMVIISDAVEVLHLVSSVLPLVALFQVFDGLSAVTAGVLRAQGRQASFNRCFL